MKKNKIDRDIVAVLIMTLITLVAWAGFEVYRAYTRRDIPPVLAKQLMELKPVLDTSVLNRLEQRVP